MRYFIGKIILGGVREGIYDYYDVTCSLAKIIIFCG